MSGRPWWRLAHRLGRVPAWLGPAVLALALAVQAGVHQPVFRPQRPSLAVGVSIAP